MLQYIPRGQKDARSFFQCPGINMDCEIFHWGQSTSGVGDQGQRSNVALAAVPIANHWLWTRDIVWLNSTGWPSRRLDGLAVSRVNLEHDGGERDGTAGERGGQGGGGEGAAARGQERAEVLSA